MARRWMAGWALVLGMALGMGSAWGQTDAQAVMDPRIAERLACLTRPAKPSFPTRNRYDDRVAALRVKLRFEPGRAKPQLEVLHAVADAELQELAFAYLEGFRLPCLGAGDPVVEAIQDMRLDAQTDPSPVAWASDPSERFDCVVTPPTRPDFNPSFLFDSIEHVIVVARFEGDGNAPPEVALKFTSGYGRAEESALNHVRSYRMPCRKAGDPPVQFEQPFVFVPQGYRRTLLKRTEFSLRELLGFVRDLTEHAAYFDLNSMGCPFQVRLNLLQPRLLNRVTEAPPRNPNRAAFLHWLSTLRLNWPNERQERDLFGVPLTVQIPCGTVDLRPSPPAAASSPS